MITYKASHFSVKCWSNMISCFLYITNQRKSWAQTCLPR